MAELTLEALRGELAPLRADLDTIKAELLPIRARIDGLPLINRSIMALQQDVRSVKAAINDAANITELEARITTLERLVRELRER
jgi:prefoldin subunit 5